MKSLPPTTFRLRDLPVQRQFVLAPELVRDAMDGAPGQSELEVASPGDVTTDIEVYEEQGTVMARGTLAGWVHLACSRCLGPVKFAISEQFFLTFLPHASHADQETDLELDEGDVDTATYSGEELDLAPILRDHLVLSNPYAPLCKDDCLGLCVQCGQDKNAGPCDCAPVADTRWDALKKLKVE